jgi:imidazole glycerol-phosphate synthase subunit HisF
MSGFDDLEMSMFFNAPPSVFEKAKLLRENPTKTEMLLWELLRNKSLGVKFRRQHPINFFVVDFYCHEKKLVIELDGEYHLKVSQKREDDLRDIELKELGLRVLRYTDNQVINNPNQVIEDIKHEIGIRNPNTGY